MKISPNGVLIFEGIAIFAILLLAIFLRTFHLDQNGLGNMYYAAAARSMASSWHAFYYASLDPGGFITVDKPPFALWIQALSARVFGYSGIALLLPQAIAGTLCIVLTWHLTRRAFGPFAAGLAALFLTVAPVCVAVDRSNMPDTWLTLVLLLSAWSTLQAAESGRWLPLLLAAFWIGVGFNFKMLAAFGIVPILFLVWAWGTSGLRMPWSRRIGQIAVSFLVLTLSTTWWMLTVDATPKDKRPYIGGSSNNTVRDLALGYNGLGRVAGQGPGGPNGPGGPGGVPPFMLAGNMPPFPSGPDGGMPGMRGGRGPFGPGGPGGIMFGGAPGPLRLIVPGMAEQILFLAPLCLSGLIFPWLIARFVSERMPDQRQKLTITLFGGWLFLYAVVFSFARGIFHPYYLSLLGPPIAALAGIGVASLIGAFASRSIVLQSVGLSSISLVVGWQWMIIRNGQAKEIEGMLLPWVLAGLVIAFATVIGSCALRHKSASRIASAGGMAMTMFLAVPSLYWSWETASHPGNNVIPMASLGNSGMSALPGMPPGMGQMPGGPGGPSVVTEESRELSAFLLKNRRGAKFIVAARSSMEASPLIVASGAPVIALGGFNGSDSVLSIGQFKQMVARGEVRYVLIGGGPMGGPGGFPPMMGGNGPGRGGSNEKILQWVRENGKRVDPTLYRTNYIEGDDEDFPMMPPFLSGMGQELYELSAS